MNPYRERYHRELDELKTLTEELAKHVGIAIEQSVIALRDFDVEMAKDIIKGDQKVDDMSQKIENLCMELLALQQPWPKT
jgi:phosphate transport system protein